MNKYFIIRIEQPITTEDSEPEPDISVVFGTREDFKTGHPKTARLVVEISINSYDLDYEKQFIYAKANIEEYWLFNINSKEVEVYKKPQNGKYSEMKIYRETDSISINDSEISLAQFLI